MYVVHQFLYYLGTNLYDSLCIVYMQGGPIENIRHGEKLLVLAAIN